MVSRSLLLVLLVLACAQFFTTAYNGNGPKRCCFKYQKTQIPVGIITDYEVTEHQCTKPGVIFTLVNGRRVCADPKVKWVQEHKNTINQLHVQQA
ncbi:C-C motif chemokine 3-like [Clarias gariepinus]|uniref:C-C motif chemokine 3-like n=1 Tax=Clarias gariepinus TaxID=13013 RepID=UPI00234C5CA4|nr:C-C motif chemokine 3-like [Clarias gariepinus]